MNAVCYGAKVLLPGVLRFDEGVEPGMEIAIMSTKGEAVALGEGVFLKIYSWLCVLSQHSVCMRMKLTEQHLPSQVVVLGLSG